MCLNHILNLFIINKITANKTSIINIIMFKIKLKNIANARKYISEKLSKIPLNKHFRDEEIEELLHYHPDKVIGNIHYLVMKIRKPYNTKSLYFKSNNFQDEDDISYIYCIKNLFGKFSDNKRIQENVLTAFRNAIQFNGNKKQYFLNNSTNKDGNFMAKCDNCNEYKKATTDHFLIPYIQIFNNFITINNIKLCDIEIEENNNIIRLKDNVLEQKWVKYHDDNAIYRILCKSCNSLFGSYGFKKTIMP